METKNVLIFAAFPWKTKAMNRDFPMLHFLLHTWKPRTTFTIQILAPISVVLDTILHYNRHNKIDQLELLIREKKYKLVFHYLETKNRSNNEWEVSSHVLDHVNRAFDRGSSSIPRSSISLLNFLPPFICLPTGDLSWMQ